MTASPILHRRGSTHLRRSDCSWPGLRRLRQGRGFRYVDERGDRVSDCETLQRIRELAIPPAWTDVWICPLPNGHLQAVGTDARGRRQYLYHPRWRQRRDQQKFDAMIEFARALPELRAVSSRDLDEEEPTRERVLAAAIRLLDRGFFRVGSEEYATDNETWVGDDEEAARLAALVTASSFSTIRERPASGVSKRSSTRVCASSSPF